MIPGISIHQTYDFLTKEGVHYRWDATLAKQLCEGREPSVMLSHECFTEESIQELYPDLDRNYAMTTNPEIPGIYIDLQDGSDTQIIIDGWHRLYKAMKTAIPFPLILLTPEEDIQCRLPI